MYRFEKKQTCYTDLKKIFMENKKIIFLVVLIAALILYVFLNRRECDVDMPGNDFVEIPAGWFILPKNTKYGYDIDSVFVPSFFPAKKNTTAFFFESVVNGHSRKVEFDDNNGFVNGLDKQTILDFVYELNQKGMSKYRIASDVEWMRAYQYLKEVGAVNDFFDGPAELCFWLNSSAVHKGDTLTDAWWKYEKLRSSGSFISKGDSLNLYNRDLSAKPCGIRLVLMQQF